MQRISVQALAAVAAVGLMVTGCGSSDSGSSSSASKDAGSSNSAGAQDKPSTPREQLLLGQADFPAGAQIQKVTAKQMADAADQMSEAMKNAKVDPANCADSQEKIAKAQAETSKNASIVAAVDMNGGTNYVSTVSESDVDLKKLEDTATGSCSDVKMTVSAPGQPAAEVSMKNTALDLPAGLPDGAFAYKTVNSTKLPDGSPQQGISMAGYAKVRGLNVGVKAQSLSGDVDPTAFDKLFAAAVKKVQDAK